MSVSYINLFETIKSVRHLSEIPFLFTDAVTDHRRGRTTPHGELSSKAKREQALRNILTARRRQILNQRSHEPHRILSSRRPRPGDIISKDPPDVLETQETRHDIYVTNARTEISVEEETPQLSRKSIEKVSMINLDAVKVEMGPETMKTLKDEALLTPSTEKYENISSTSSSIAPTPTMFANQKLGDADTRKKNTVSMPESLYNHFRPVERNIPVEDMSQFLYFGQKLQPDAQNTTNNSNNNSVETTSTNPTSSRRRYSAKRFSATIATPVEEIMNEEMNIALETLERRTIEKNQVPRIKNMFRSSSNGLYYRKPRPTADVVSNVIPGNESSPGIVSGSETRSEMNAVDDKFHRGDPSTHADRTRDRVPEERGNAVHVTEASTTTQISRQRQSDDAEVKIVESEIDAKLSNGTVTASNGAAEGLERTTNNFGKDNEKKKVSEMKTEIGNAEKLEHKLTNERAMSTLQRARPRESDNNTMLFPSRSESSTLRIVVPDDSFGLSSFAIESERTHRNTVKQQPVTDPVADRPVRVSTGGDIAPKSSPSLTSPLTTESSAPAIVDSDQQPQQQQQQHPQQHVYAYTITNVTRLLRNYTGLGLSGEEEKRKGGGAAGRRAGSSAEITSGEPSQQRPQQQPPPLPSSPLLLPRASDGSIEPARTPAGLSAGATVEPAAAVGALPSVVDGLVGERSRKVVPQQQRATSQRTAATWSSSNATANDSVISSTRSIKSPEIGNRGSVKWNHTKSRTSEQEGVNDRRFLRKSASAVLNQRSTVNEESSSLAASKRRRVLTSPSGVSSSSGTRRVKSGGEKIENAKDKLEVNNRLSNGTRVAGRGKVSDDEVSGVDSLREVSRASGVNEMPSDSSLQETTVMGILSRNSSATDETTDATDPSVFVDAITTTELEKSLLEEDIVSTSNLNDESDIGSNAEDDQGVAMLNKTESDVNATTNGIVETTVTVTEQIDEITVTPTTSTTTTSTTTTAIPAAPIFPVTPRILTEQEKTTTDLDTHTLRPTDIVKEANNLDPSEIQKRYRAKDTMTTSTTTTTTVPPIQSDTHVNETSNRKSKVLPTSSTPAVTENGKRVSGERSPEVRARNLSDKSKDKDDVLPIMHLYNTSDIFNGSGPMDGFARGTERPRVVLPVDSEPQNEDSLRTTTATATREKIPELMAINNTEINRSTSTTVPVSKFKESTVTLSSRKDKPEENGESQDTVVPPVSKGSSFTPTANRTRYRPTSILPEYNGTMYHPSELNRTFFATGEPISVSPRESLNVSEVILKRHDGDVIATQETVAVVGYILATLVVFPIAVGVGLILRRLILRNRKVSESEVSRSPACNLA